MKLFLKWFICTAVCRRIVQNLKLNCQYERWFYLSKWMNELMEYWSQQTFNDIAIHVKISVATIRNEHYFSIMHCVVYSVSDVYAYAWWVYNIVIPINRFILSEANNKYQKPKTNQVHGVYCCHIVPFILTF